MDWLVNLARNPIRNPGFIGLALWMVCFIAFLACMKYARVESARVALRGADYRWAIAIRQVGYAQQQATLTATATITPTLTATSTISPDRDSNRHCYSQSNCNRQPDLDASIGFFPNADPPHLPAWRLLLQRLRLTWLGRYWPYLQRC